MARADDVAQLAQAREDWVKPFPRGSLLLREGDLATAFYLVCAGRVVVAQEGSEGGKPQILHVLRPGGIVGAVAALTGGAYEVSARALDPVRALEISDERVAQFFQESPGAALGLARELAQAAADAGAAWVLPAEPEEMAALFDASPVAEEEPTPPAPTPLPESPTRVADQGEQAERSAGPLLDMLALAPSLAGGPPRQEKAKERSPAPAPAPAAQRRKPALDAFYTEAIACPVCDSKSEATRVRTSALNVVKRESDMRAVYEGVNPVHYAVYICPSCYYAAYADDWGTLTNDEQEQIAHDAPARQAAAGHYDIRGERDLTVVMASYLLALRCYDLRVADPRRRAGVLHRLAWTARETGDPELEARYLALARRDYEDAFEHDTSLSETGAMTVCYLIGDLALRLGDIQGGVRWFERTLRLERSNRHPEIARMTRDRWADAKDALQARGA